MNQNNEHADDLVNDIDHLKNDKNFEGVKDQLEDLN